MRNKRGAAIAVNTIIFLILGIAILVMLILGFTIGFNKLLPFLSSENVKDVVTACNSACITSSQYAFCTQNRTLIDENKIEYRNSCNGFATDSEFSKFGIDTCGPLTC